MHDSKFKIQNSKFIIHNETECFGSIKKNFEF